MNTDRKIGNLADWVERWGGSYEAMLVLDADSLMSGEAIVADPTADEAPTPLVAFPTGKLGAEASAEPPPDDASTDRADEPPTEPMGAEEPAPDEPAGDEPPDDRV